MEQPVPVVCEELGIGQEPIGRGQPLAFTPRELGLDGRVREMPFQDWTEDKSQLAVECDQVPIKGPIEVRRQAEPILGIETVLKQCPEFCVNAVPG